MDSNLSGDVAAGTAAVVVQGLWRHRRGEAGLAGWWAGRAASLRSPRKCLRFGVAERTPQVGTIHERFA